MKNHPSWILDQVNTYTELSLADKKKLVNEIALSNGLEPIYSIPEINLTELLSNIKDREKDIAIIFSYYEVAWKDLQFINTFPLNVDQTDRLNIVTESLKRLGLEHFL